MNQGDTSRPMQATQEEFVSAEPGELSYDAQKLQL